MLYALLDPAHPHGAFLRDRHGELVGVRVFDAVETLSGDEKKARASVLNTLHI
jgi:hypothetical protein